MHILTPELQPRWNSIIFNVFKKFIDICKTHNLKYYCVGGTLIGAVRHHGIIPWDDDIDVCMPRPDYDRFRKICQEEDLGNYELHCAENTKNYYFQFSKLCDKSTTIMEDANVPCVFGLFIDIFPADGIGNDYNEAIRIRHKYVKVQNQLESITTRSSFIDYIKLLGDSFQWGRFVHKTIGFFFRRIYHNILMHRLDKMMRAYKYDSSKYVIPYGGVYGNKEIYPKEWIEQTISVPFEDFMVEIPQHYDEFLRHYFGDYMKLPPIEQRHYKHSKVFFDLDRGLTVKQVKEIMKKKK